MTHLMGQNHTAERSMRPRISVHVFNGTFGGMPVHSDTGIHGKPMVNPAFFAVFTDMGGQEQPGDWGRGLMT